ncbi:hypothetical protein DYD21_10540 [Rhodohalobacter sp. SW132]|uniref:hypothetical protein n=1 Tax=Rhodohalobacter sp. SW132 TaxID=2293433 RepID=UPI000E248E57|nr:hypothetical protein [Rhodohalobacter sp. SW132]REL33834.1 hypothetical protein DYD21_10540 [Rhodohalobacter sp. SW132]
MKQTLFLVLLLIVTSLYTVENTTAQQREVPTSQMFRLAEGIVRIAEPGQLADSVNVWGDVSAPGRYVVPRGTRAHELISYARGPIGFRTGETTLDWSKMRLEVNISRYDHETGEETVQNFRFRYNEPYPAELRRYRLSNDEIISLEVKRRAAFVDYVRVIAPVLTAVATGFLIVDRL